MVFFLIRTTRIACRTPFKKYRGNIFRNFTTKHIATEDLKSCIQRKSIKSVFNTCVANDEVRVQGWVKALRKLKHETFLEISDGSSFHRLPVVMDSSNRPLNLNMHSSVDITGTLKPSPKNVTQLELHPSTISVVGTCDQKLYPLGGKIRYTDDHIRQFLHLRPKTNKFSSLLRLRSAAMTAVHNFFHENEFIQVHTPILTSNDCEGAGETFSVMPSSETLIKEIRDDSEENVGRKSSEIFFDRNAYLTVSSQLHLEAASSGLNKVWTMSPVFRAENSRSTKHLSEFYMIEAEESFAYEVDHIISTMERLVKHCVRSIVVDNIEELKKYTNDDKAQMKSLESIMTKPFTIMTFAEAESLLLKKENSAILPGKGLSKEQELLLVQKLNGGIPIFVIDWPLDTKPFYMKCSPDKSNVQAVDLLVPVVGELCGGSLRENNLSQLENRMLQCDPSGNLKKSLDWYLDLRKYGNSSTGGFGLGFDRFMQLITGCENIRDVTLFPRWPHHCSM